MKSMLTILLVIASIFFDCECNDGPTKPKNDQPVIKSLTAVPSQVNLLGTSVIICQAIDREGDKLTYEWATMTGSITSQGDSAIWTAPNYKGFFSVKCKVLDINNGQDIDSVTIEVRDDSLKQGLIAYYPFSSNADDESGNNNHGQIYGPILTKDRFGNPNKAYLFNGINQYIKVKDSPSLDISTAITITAWRYMTSKSWGRMVRKVNTWGPSHGGYILTAGDNYINTELQLSTNYNGVTIIRKDTTLNLNQWDFIAMTFNGMEVSLFLNGVKIYSEPHLGTINVNDKEVYIGSSEGVEFFAGKIDEIRIYDRALSNEEIMRLFNMIN